MDQDQPSLISEDVYRAPAGENLASHSTFSAEEWRYMRRVFALWFLGGAVLIALVVTYQMYVSLSAFGGTTYLARVMTLAIFDSCGSGLVMAAACNTLAMVAEKRAKQSILQPVLRLPWRIAGMLALATPLAIVLLLALSLLLVTFVAGIPWSESWEGIQTSAHGSDVAISILSVVVGAVVLIAYVAPVMRLLFRFRGWLILKFIIMGQVMGVVLVLVRLVGRALFK